MELSSTAKCKCSHSRRNIANTHNNCYSILLCCGTGIWNLYAVPVSKVLGSSPSRDMQWNVSKFNRLWAQTQESGTLSDVTSELGHPSLRNKNLKRS